MADVKPLKLVDQGGGAGRLEEFGAGDRVPAENLPATEWSAETVSQAEAEAGTATTRQAWTAQRVRQAIVARWNDVTTAWGRGFVASADAAAGRTALGLRTAAVANVQTSPTDTTAGALMAVGAFGLGTSNAQTSTGDVNGLRLGGIFAPVSQANAPTTECVLWSGGRANGARAAQFAIDHGLIPKAWVRGYNGGRTAGTEWGSWYELYHRGNIVGTVSQTSNIPTGAVIERGSNANGEYVRFADGTQICWLRSFRVTQSGSSSTILERAWFFPASFSNTDVVTLVSHSNNAARRNELNLANFKRAFSDTNMGSGSVNIGIEFTSGVIAASWIDVPVYAIGRWY